MASNHVAGVAGPVMSSGGNNDLWRECVDWLTRCQIIPTDHMANSPTAEIRVLALTLRDGVLLCNLVLHLDPTCMDASDFTRRPQMAQFLCCKNIKLFIDVCRNHFKLRESDLFDPDMLYDLTNFHRVLITLSKLSQCAKVQQLHPKLEGFNLQLSANERSHSDEAIYKDLHSTEIKHNDSLDTSSECFDHTSQNGSLSVEDDISDITNENGTENTDDYVEDNVSALSENIDDENTSAQPYSNQSDTSSKDCFNTTTKQPPQKQHSTTSTLTFKKRSISSSGVGNNSLNESLDGNQQLQRVAAAAYNYQTATKEIGGNDYLRTIYSEEEEKVYEDLCYVTFSTKRAQKVVRL